MIEAAEHTQVLPAVCAAVMEKEKKKNGELVRHANDFFFFYRGE